MTLASNVPGKENRVYRKPLGVVGVISPWNFPLHLSQRSIAPALALGNAVVVKPASDTPVTGGLLLAKIFEEAGLPEGLLSVVVGAGSEIGDAFVEHRVPRLISFTGSTQVGRGIGRIASGGEHIKKVSLELGGNSPFVVLDDADIEQAVNAAAMGKFLHQGQICMAVNRIIVAESRYDAFVERFVEKVKGLQVGDPDDMATVVGPVINAKQREGLEEKIATAKREGATVLLEGEIQGQLVPPHVFGDVTAEMEISREEIFGPLVGIQKARDEAHALDAGQRHRVWPLQRGVQRRPGPRPALRPGHQGGHDPRQRHAGQRRGPRALRRREELRPGPLQRRLGHRGVHHRPLDQRAARAARLSLLRPRAPGHRGVARLPNHQGKENDSCRFKRP
jgi:acyl-CoA reductase-like NAD-dependent aldehyde dehydrogenase